MIRKLRGRVDSVGWGQAVVEVGGVGYLVYTPLSARQALVGADGREVELYVHTRIREERIELFGFVRPQELEAFEWLLQVNGVGPRIALSALSTLEVEQLYRALAEGRVDVLRRVPGVGPRMAERLCVELRAKARERVGGGPSGRSAGDGAAPSAPDLPDAHPAAADAVAALMALGFSRAEARQAVRRASARVDARAAVEELIRVALSAAGGDSEG